jgi:hypothetical protein
MRLQKDECLALGSGSSARNARSGNLPLDKVPIGAIGRAAQQAIESLTSAA